MVSVEGPKSEEFQFGCIPDTQVAYKEVFGTVDIGLNTCDTTMDVGQSMILFCAGQPFFVGAGTQISMAALD